ncbi:MAG: hypothetical protein ACI857_002995 [Arenicella sp.]|jgi:hypothetical protein
MHKLIILLLLSFSSLTFSQELNFSNQWTFLGPDKKPLEDKRQSATGIGPVDYVEVNQQKQGNLLACSLNGGLFYTTNDAEQWYNAGSDDWDYSGCSMAVYHPSNQQIIFANSCKNNPNGSAGNIGFKGGVYRTLDEGISWELIGGRDAFTNSEFLKVHGIVVNPANDKELIVYTTEGIYKTKDCLASNVEWDRIPNVGGWVYDVAFYGDQIYFTSMQHGKWSVFSGLSSKIADAKKLEFSNSMIDNVETVSVEAQGSSLLVLINYKRKGDELHQVNPINGRSVQVLKNQKVVFGKGQTFTVNPHNEDEIILGYSTTIKRWSVVQKTENRMKGGYHVDIEDVKYDVFDSTRIILATHGGIYISYDKGESWVSKSNGIGIAEVEGLAVSAQDINVMAIGCFHDGSSLRADFDNNGIYEWKNINGGDGLMPIIPNNNLHTVYTSNQYSGGGMFYSADTGKTKKNLHSMNNVRTSGWQMAAVLHPEEQDMIFFNFEVPSGSGKGNIDIGRTNQPLERRSLDRVTNFKVSHDIPKYTIYGVYNSSAYPDVMFAHMIEPTVDEDGKKKNVHRIWRTDNCMAKDSIVIHSWYEVDVPRSDWVSSIQLDPKSSNRMLISYVSGIYGTENSEDADVGLIYSMKLKKSTKAVKKEVDISNNIPFSFTGRFNLVSDDNGGFFYATRSGVYWGDKKTLKGKRDWKKIGFGTPHCKVHGLHYSSEERVLSVGYYGRGVWRYNL